MRLDMGLQKITTIFCALGLATAAAMSCNSAVAAAATATATATTAATAATAATAGSASGAGAVANASNAAVAAREPLLMAGKSTMYQRVLTTPSCKLLPSAAASGAASGEGEEVHAFSQYYVYGDAGSSYEVGTDTRGEVVGFLPKDCVLPWKLPMSMFFTSPTGRHRALVFDKQSALDRIIDSPDGSGYYRAIYEQVLNKSSVDNVVSIEPDKYDDQFKRFYFLPIFDSVESLFPDGNYLYKHEIASVAAHGADGEYVQSSGANDRAIVGFKAAVLFVIDASLSMQSHSDRIKQAVGTIYKSIKAKNLEDSVQFGIVSFHSGTQNTATMVLSPDESMTVEQFNKRVANLKQAAASGKHISKDSYAGVNLALQDINWSQYGARYIVLLTDAGAIDASDLKSSTGLDATDLRLDAEHRGTAIYTLHMFTDESQRSGNYAVARRQYETLSFNEVLNKSLYYSANAASVEEFSRTLDFMAHSLTSQVELASWGALSAGSALAAEDDFGVAEDSVIIGEALPLSYVGAEKGAAVPEVIRGWISDRDLVTHNKIVGIPAVLVNRKQLEDMYIVVSGLFEACILGQPSADGMFQQLQVLASQIGMDPKQLNWNVSIRNMGIMGEMLAALPYKSRIADFTSSEWFNLSSQEQEDIIRDLENSLFYLQYCRSDKARFVKLNPDADDSEAVYPIPLDALP